MYKYRLIFEGRHCKQISIDIISKDQVRQLKLIDEDEDEDGMLYAAQDILTGSEFYVLGIDAVGGQIKVYQTTDFENDDLCEEAAHTLDVSTINIETHVSLPTPESFILANVNSQDGVIGHIDLEIEEEFQPQNLTLIESSADKYGGESAIDGISYKTGGTCIEENINPDIYLETSIKVELCWVSFMDKDGEEVPLYENNEWVDDDGRV